MSSDDIIAALTALAKLNGEIKEEKPAEEKLREMSSFLNPQTSTSPMGGESGVGLNVMVIARNICPDHGYAHHPLDNRRDEEGKPINPESWDAFPDCQGGVIGISQ